MPDTTLTINHAGGGSETYTINRDKFEGVRTMTVTTFGESTSVVYPASPQDVTGFTVTNADLMSGTYVSDGLYQGKPSFRHTTFSGYKIRWEVTEWEFHDGSSEDQVQFTGRQDTDYPWEITSWNIENANSGSPVFSNPVGGYFEETTVVVDGTTTETYTVDHTPPEDLRNLLIDAQNITINRDEGEEIRTLFIDGVEVTIDRTGEVAVKRFLELFIGAAAAFSLQQLGDYQALLNARRGSDNVEVDVYPDSSANREVSASSPITVTSGSSSATTFGEFLTEGGSHDAFVTTWYDQAGSNDASQPLDDAQPKIAENGSVIDGIDCGQQSDALFLQASSFTSLSFDSLSSFVVASTNGYSGVGSCALGLNTIPRYYLPLTRPDGIYFSYNALEAIKLSNNTTEPLSLISTVSDSSTTSAFLNGVTGGSVSSVSGNSANISIGYNGGTAYHNGLIKEVVLYASDQSAKRADIEANINGRYSIY